MHTTLWVLASVLAGVFLVAGAAKLTKTRDALAEMGLAYVEDFSDGTIKAIGALEVLAAIGLILPPLLGIAPVLAPLSATGLAIIMVGAIVVHARRDELAKSLPLNAALLILAAVVAWGRFGPYAW